jgi:hypothetical protein
MYAVVTVRGKVLYRGSDYTAAMRVWGRYTRQHGLDSCRIVVSCR